MNDGLALKTTRRLLLDWVNLPTPVTDDWLDSMLKKHPDVFGSFADRREDLRTVVEMIRMFLQEAWKATDMRKREWCLFIARQKYNRALVGTWSLYWVKRFSVGGEALLPFLSGVTELASIVAPPETALDRTLFYARRMSFCEGPSCEERYFLRGPKRERYCSECKREARLHSKKKYWNETGKFARAKNSLHKKKVGALKLLRKKATRP